MTEASKDLSEILEARGKCHGAFMGNAEYAQMLKSLIRLTKNWDVLAPDQKEAMDNIMQKSARLLNGDPNHLDGWVDIAGYSTLVADRLKKQGAV